MSKGDLCPCTYPSLWLFRWTAEISLSLSFFCSDIASLTSFSYSPFLLTGFRLSSPYLTSLSIYFLFNKVYQLLRFSSLSSWSSLDIYLRSWFFLTWTEERWSLALCGPGSVWAQEAPVISLAATFKSICKEILGWLECRRHKLLCGDNAVGLQKAAHAQDRNFEEFICQTLPYY